MTEDKGDSSITQLDLETVKGGEEPSDLPVSHCILIRDALPAIVLPFWVLPSNRPCVADQQVYWVLAKPDPPTQVPARRVSHRNGVAGESS